MPITKEEVVKIAKVYATLEYQTDKVQFGADLFNLIEKYLDKLTVVDMLGEIEITKDMIQEGCTNQMFEQPSEGA